MLALFVRKARVAQGTAGRSRIGRPLAVEMVSGAGSSTDTRQG